MTQTYVCASAQDLGAGVKGVPFTITLRRVNAGSADIHFESTNFYEKLLKGTTGRAIDCDFFATTIDGQDSSEQIKRGEELAQIHFQLCRFKSDFNSIRESVQKQRVGYFPWKLRKQREYFVKVGIRANDSMAELDNYSSVPQSSEIRALLQSCSSLANEKNGVVTSHEGFVLFVLTVAGIALGAIGAAKL